LCKKDISFKWALVAIYGLAQANLKERFLTEMVHLCSHGQLPILVGGDFNMLRNPSDKNKDSYEHRWPFLFNSVIDGLNLRELEMSGRRFTWANSLSNPTCEKLDRVLVSTEWEQKFPLITVTSLSRDISDHTPLLLNTGRAPSSGNQPLFKFELGWLLHEGFTDMVKEVWECV
jgi:exonuclease III